MNQRDKEIILHLRRNARMPLTRISKKTSIPISTIFDRIKANANDTILKHTSLLNFRRMGFHAQANISLKVQPEDSEALKDFLLSHPAINSAYKTDGRFDFLVEAIFKDAKDMEIFVEEIKKRFRIMDTHSSLILEDLKRESFMSGEGVATL